MAAEVLAQKMNIVRGQIGAADDPQCRHFLNPARPDPMEPSHWHCGNKCRPFTGAHHADPVWLVLIAGQFGDELVVGHPGTGGQPGFGLDPGPDQFGDPGGGADPFQIFGDVEIGLIQAERLDMRGIVQKDLGIWREMAV